ncbi:hypothetical protein [Streptomyces sp. NPDC060198]|uniref:hypothetical protein n=1 Tax=Streptomyces sp. NPDC060198 TaxID=3347070 RepID=UPI00365C8F3B
MILAALAGGLSAPARTHFFTTLWRLVGGHAHHSEQALGRDSLGDECRARAREGLWLIVRLGITGSADDADTAADICELVDPDDERSSYYQALPRERAVAKAKRRHAR